MAKSKKKRNKKYAGVDAANTSTTVTKVSVPNRSSLGKWWYENKSKWRNRAILIAVLAALYLIISWLFRLIF